MKALLFLLLITAVACQSPQKKGTQSQDPETQQAAFVAEDAIVFELAVDGMTCSGCEQAITKSVESLDGVQWVKASHTDAKVMVALSKSNADTALVRQKITDTGYQVGTIVQQADSIQ